MKIDGRFISSQIKETLKEKIARLKEKNVIPHLAVILIGNDPGSETYVRQKLKVGEEIGVMVTLYRLPSGKDTPGNKAKLIDLVHKLNKDNSVHGIIVQRPCPMNISKEELDLLVMPEKDVDGFHPKSTFTPPVASAVLKILEWVYKDAKVEEFNSKFIDWLKKQEIVVIGRGETAGHPIAETLKKITDKITIAHSKTKDMKKVCLSADIIISCVGRPHIVRLPIVSTSTLLIGVGLHPENGKLATDYDQSEIADKVAFYTPVPGGVGPVNVACLFENLLLAV